MSKEFPQLPKEEIGDKKEEQKQSAKSELPENLTELKKREDKKNWLKEKFDVWRHEK